MKRLIPLMILGLFLITLMSASVFAVGCFPPYPIWGKFNYYGLIDGTIEISAFNVIYGQTFTTTTSVNENGEYSSGLCSLENGYYNNMVVTVSIVDCDAPGCTTSFTAVDGGTFRHDFIFGDQGYFCWDGSTADTLAECPAEPEEEKPEPTVEEANKVSTTDKELASVEANYGQLINIELTDTKLSKLLDGEIDFDGEAYDAEEVISLQAVIKTSIDDEDFGTNPYLTIAEGAIVYK
ncbi:hypothetical protein LCGC14_2640190, partial [marine sediment metagenome]